METNVPEPSYFLVMIVQLSWMQKEMTLQKATRYLISPAHGELAQVQLNYSCFMYL